MDKSKIFHKGIVEKGSTGQGDITENNKVSDTDKTCERGCGVRSYLGVDDV